MAKTYAIADIHGMWDIYEQVNAMLNPEDLVYFLGDAGDRGYNGFKCIKAIYENSQWIYLKGNHEDLMVNGLRNIRDYDITNNSEDFDLWMWNGGNNTYEEWLDDGEDFSWIEKLNNLPVKIEYTNFKDITFHMTHAGYTCGHIEEMWSDQLIWSRKHFYSIWDEKNYPNDICIHGHTPNEYLVRRYLDWRERQNIVYKTGCPAAISYCNGHKICIDNGVFYTKATILYDLDEMTAIPLYDRTNFEW